MTIRALAGDAHSRGADTAFDTDKWKEAHFLHKLHEGSGNFDLVMNWSVTKVSHLNETYYFQVQLFQGMVMPSTVGLTDRSLDLWALLSWIPLKSSGTWLQYLCYSYSAAEVSSILRAEAIILYSCSHRHVRFGLFFHSLAMIQTIRHGSIPQLQKNKYLQQIDINQEYIRSYASSFSDSIRILHALGGYLRAH
jgi:hypothetical protein